MKLKYFEQMVKRTKDRQLIEGARKLRKDAEGLASEMGFNPNTREWISSVDYFADGILSHAFGEQKPNPLSEKHEKVLKGALGPDVPRRMF